MQRMLPLQPLFTRTDVSNSVVIADVLSKDCSGMKQDTFEQIHAKLTGSGHFQSSDWTQKVVYTAPANPCDSNQNTVLISYMGADPCNVSCNRVICSNSIHLKTEDGHWMVHAYRQLIEEAQPPASNERYNQVNVRMERTLLRKSSSVKNLEWKYVFGVHWKARSVRDAYAATPTYHLRLEITTSALYDKIKDNLMEDATAGEQIHAEAEASMDGLNDYLASTTLLKLQEVVCAELKPFEPAKRNLRNQHLQNEDGILHDEQELLIPETETGEDGIEEGFMDDGDEAEQTDYYD